MSGQMKAREKRIHVVLPARMRTQDGWIDVVIRDMSSRGIGLRSQRAPLRGSYVEVCRLEQKLVGRVVWARGSDFGIILRERIATEQIASDRAPNRLQNGCNQERRFTIRQPSKEPRTIEERENLSRHISRIICFWSIVLVSSMAAAFMYDAVSKVLSVPAHAVLTGLAN